jgi:heme O synthase-like polyprenyltransferase
VASSIALAVVAKLGPLYYGSALILGVLFVARAVDVREFPAPAADRGMFFFSIKYLGLLLIAAMVDRAIPWF